MKKDKLAIDGGIPAVNFPLKPRGHFGEEEQASVLRLFSQAIRSGYAPGYNGKEEDAFCKEFAAYLGGGYSDGVNSGTNSVYVALHALDLPPFSEVIVGPVTDPGGIMPIVMLNCIPVVADAEPGSFNTGAAQVEACITPRTSAIVIPHIGGAPADIKAIMKVAKKHKLPVVEDCAQAHGASVDGQKVGTFGTYGAFSLMFGKHFCAGGQGGAIFSKTEDLYWKERRAADRGKPFNMDGHTNVRAAINCNMDEFGAAIGRAQLKKLPQIIAKRQAFVEMLMRRGIGELETITIPKNFKTEDATYALRISGNSMEPKYRNGDVLLVQESDTVEVGELGIFLLDGSGFFKVYGGDQLISLNDEYGPIPLKDYSDVRCKGRVIGKLKRK